MNTLNNTAMRDSSVVIIGAGMTGVLLTIKLRQVKPDSGCRLCYQQYRYPASPGQA